MSYRTILVWVADSRGLEVAGAQVTIDDIGKSHSGITDSEGMVTFEVSDLPQSHLWITAEGYQDYNHHLDLPPTDIQIRVGVAADPERHDVLLPPIQPIAPPVPAIERLHVENLAFVTESGNRWWMKFLDGFRDYERFLRGEDIRPLLEETVAVGANGRRVWGMFDFGSPEVQRLYPSEWGAVYYDRMPEFFALYAEYGLYIQWAIFVDTQRACPGADAQWNLWNRVTSIFIPITNVLLEACNEINQHENRPAIDPPKPAGICSSRGSNGAGDDPPEPFWDYSDLHSERRDDFAMSTTTVNWSIKGYGTAFPGTHRATVVSEPPGFADNPSGSRTNNPVIAYQLGLGCRGWGAGGTAHSDCGVQSILLTPTQRACVEAFIRGVSAP